MKNIFPYQISGFPLIVLSLLFCSTIYSQTPFLVKDISQSKIFISNSSINRFAETDNFACFFADDGIHGTELWITDGTSHGTKLLKDIFPGRDGSVGLNIEFCRLGNELFFPISSSGDVSINSQLWKTDGTPEGTVLVAVMPIITQGPEEITPFGNKVIFKVREWGSSNYSLWISDGTPQGTNSFKQFNETTYNPLLFFPYQNGLLFVTGTLDEGTELWKTDGTTEGTVLVKDIYPGSVGSFPDNFTLVKDNVYFTCNHPSYGNQIWMTDGTEIGTTLLKELKAESVSAEPNNLMEVNDSLYFTASNQNFERILWNSDGSANYTLPVKSSFQGQQPPVNISLVKCDSFVLAHVNNENNWELWRKNGSDGNYFKFKEYTLSGTSNFPYFDSWISSGNISYFTLNTSADRSKKLWITDGTEDGTRFLKSIDGAYDFNPMITGFSIFANDLYFSSVSPNYSVPVWKSDGSPEGTSIIKEVRNETNSGTGSYAFNIDDTLFFPGYKDQFPFSELWRSEGIGSNTRTAFQFDRDFSLLKSFGGFLYLNITNEFNENELWKYNSTGTIKTKLADGFNTISETFFECNGKLYFSAGNLAHGIEQWVTDGTSEGTKLLVDINPGPASTYIGSYFKSDTHLFFIGRKDSEADLLEIWAVDLSNNTPHFIKEIQPGNISLASGIGIKGGELYFVENQNAYPFSAELWKSNGTTLGTKMIGSLPISIDPGIYGATLLEDHFYFSAQNEDFGKELWRTDGTIEGTSLVKDINPLQYMGSEPIGLYKFDSLLLFLANSPEAGFEPWRSNGTPDGTFMIQDVHEGSSGVSLNAAFFAFEGKAYFGTLAQNSQKLWVTDGSLNGTYSITQFKGNSDFLLPNNFFSTNSTLYISAFSNFNQKVYGSELWSFRKCNDKIQHLPLITDISFNHQVINDSISCRCNILGELIDKVTSNGAKPINGTINSKVWIQENPPTGYVNKVFEILPDNKDSLATGLASLYFSQEDFDAYNQIHEEKLPLSPVDSTGIKNLYVELRKGESVNGSGLPVSYKKQIETIRPGLDQIKWDSINKRWEIEVVLNKGFGGFFVKAKSCVLNESFKWRGNNSQDWNNENNWIEKTKPSIGANILIPTNRKFYPLISENIIVKKLQLDPGATLTINPSVILEINEKICQ